MADPRFAANALRAFADRVSRAIGCSDAVASEVAGHLVEADLRGIASHGVFRLSQYAEQARDGVFDPSGEPRLVEADGGGPLVDGQGGFGMPAMRLVMDTAAADAAERGVGACGVANVGHTGCLGLYAERAAERGLMAVAFGGGTRATTRQVAPHGGARALLPTNPYAFAVPAGEGGPVVVDFATSAGSGGKVMAARAAGRALPEGLIVDAQGAPTTDPEAYFAGGALLPMAGARGFGLGLVAELIGEAVFHDARWGMNWIVICLDLARYRDPDAYAGAAEACLAEVAACPPAPGFDAVEVPGLRERALRKTRLADGIPVAPGVVEELRRTAADLGVGAEALAAPLAEN